MRPPRLSLVPMPGLAAPEAWEGTLEPQSIRVTQLDPGSLVFDRSVADLSCARLVSCAASVGFEGHSDLLTGKTLLGVVAAPNTDARWFGERIREDEIVQTCTSMDLTTHGFSRMYYVAMDSDKLEPSGDGFRIHRNVRHAARLREYLGTALRLSDAGTPQSGRICRGIAQAMIPLLKLCLSDEGGFPKSTALSRRVAAVRTCELYVREHIVENPTLAELCAVSGLRMRSLINAFQAVLGMSPMAYLRVQRLNEVHKALSTLEPARTRVIDVASTWGFWHMGHFTVTYRAMFGELPSETLNRRRKVPIVRAS